MHRLRILPFLVAATFLGGARAAAQLPIRDLGPPADSGAAALAHVASGEFRVCADPNNLPFSNRAGEGFENKLAELIASELHAHVVYTWWPLRRGFIRNTLRDEKCDAVMGLPSSYDLVLASEPYYRSTYVFLYRKDRGYHITSFDDPVLRTLKIGVHMIGDDYTNTPPAHALANRGIVANVKGYNIYGDYSQPNPPAELVDAVARGDVDVAIVWGPLAGYFAQKESVALEMTPVSPSIDLPFLPFVFDVSVGVRHGDKPFKAMIDGVLERRRDEVRRLLTSYGVPLVETPGEHTAAKHD